MVLILCSFYSCCFLLLLTRSCLAGDSLKYGERITSKESSLVSIGGKFKMGFFSLGGTSERTYLGIWYYQVQPPTYVWVANRDNPIPNSIGVFEISDGNAQVTDPTSGQIYWSSNLPSSSSKNWTATLKDSGNLVLYDTGTSVQWQSFQEPTDTFLSGMKMNSQLISWKANDDPARGDYTFKLSRTGDRFVISKNYQSQHYWVSERLDSDATFLWMANAPINYAYYKLKKGNKKKEFNHSTVDYSNTRLFMNSSGHIQLVRWDDLTEEWILKWSEPADVCKQYNFCGSNSSCSIINSEHVCKCLPGFESIGEQECVRKSTSCATGNDRTFLNFTMMKVGDPDITVEEVKTEALCKSQCLERCPHCLAYSYYTSYIHRDSSLCLIWINDLPNLQEHIEYNDGGLDLSVLVNHSDIVLHGRSCEPCGTNEIPYPLSTGPDCGDPVYFNFRCNNLTGELSFMMPGGPYQVTSIEPNANNFIAQVNDSHYCGANNRKQQPHSPFRVTDWCRDGKEIVVSWEPPLEPSCNKSTDCTYWPNSICGSKFGAERRCLCQSNFHWNGSNLSCMPDEPSARKIPTSTLLLLILMLTIFILLASSIVAYVWRKKTAHSHNQDGGSLQRVHESLYDSVRHVKGLIGLGGLEEQEDNEGIGVPCFNFEAILAATENFSDANKLGQGGYGPVYKGRLLGGQDIAVKRLSSFSKQGLEEFKNEIVLIAKLQHRNLVQLRGYSIKGEEKVLLYEYMPNKSLDLFLFDRTQTVLLDWTVRFDIILGVARGLLYLHQDSRLRVIHRDLKTSNILLDEEMNPKISDFGLAKIFGGKETESSTERVVGTYGYMSPEYALDGFFSIKSDVFSFGVVLLEIISGKKNTGFYQSHHGSSLLGYAWRLWTENNVVDLMDPCLRESCDANRFIRCANVGLLCVQDEPSDRPTMSNVVIMLESEIASIQTPKQPTFFMRALSGTASSSSKAETNLQIESSYIQGR